jgi:hypothetical protein
VAVADDEAHERELLAAGAAMALKPYDLMAERLAPSPCWPRPGTGTPPSPPGTQRRGPGSFRVRTRGRAHAVRSGGVSGYEFMGYESTTASPESS